MKCVKPTINMMKQREELLLNAFKQTYGYLTKTQICEIIGSKDERTARDVVAHLRKRYPIISTSDGREPLYRFRDWAKFGGENG